MDKLFENISQNFDSNVFESYTGALNVAPVKLSGQYKIVVDLDHNLYLDDYNGRRVSIDKSREFLPQVSNFLKVKTKIINKDCLRYGAFQLKTKKYFHAPIYISKFGNLPKYFVINKIIDSNVPKENCSDWITQNSDVLEIHDLEKMGLIKIFDEVLREKTFNYPVFFNFEDSYFTINGYSINKDVATEYKTSLTNYQANQPYFDVFNNSILNTFVKNDLIFPKFLNIEFEFEYIDNALKLFSNFTGYYSEGTKIENKSIYDASKVNIDLKDYTSKIEYKQIYDINKWKPELYKNIIGTSSIEKIQVQPAQIRLNVLANLKYKDSFQIIHADGSLFFEYVFETDIIDNNSLYKTLINLCNIMTSKSYHNFTFSVNTKNIITIKSNLTDNLIEDFSIRVPSYFNIIDRYSAQDDNYWKFREITKQDINLTGKLINTKNLKYVIIDNIEYSIIDKFQFNSFNIIRVNKEISFKTKYLEICETKYSEIIQLNPIPYLVYNSDYKTLEQHNNDEYSFNLIKEFYGVSEDLDFQNYIKTCIKNNDDVNLEKALIYGNKTNKNEVTNAMRDELPVNKRQFLKAILTYIRIKIFDILPYVKELEDGSLEPVNIITNENHNDTDVLDLSFNSSGNNSYIAPNIMNIDKQFYVDNGNIDLKNTKYHWFLINSKCPEYLVNDIRSLRYFQDKPKLTSRLVKITQSLCETIFLGIKYQLPSKYENYQFCVYLNPDNFIFKKREYYFEVNTIEKTIYLVVSKYLDFNDLIRGGNITNKPLIDLALFYNIRNPYNSTSDNLENFRTGGVQIFNKESVYYGPTDVIVKDWKVYDSTTKKWYLCAKRNAGLNTQNFDVLFNENETADFYVYSIITYKGQEYNYMVARVELKNIKEVRKDYVWCEDIRITFYDSNKLFINKYGNDIPEELLYVNMNDLKTVKNESTNIFGDNVKECIVSINGTDEKFKLLLPDKIFSVKETYFELVREVTYDENGTKTIKETSWTFPEYNLTAKTTAAISKVFDMNTFDNVTEYQKITLLDRNQIWRFIIEILEINTYFKFITESQVANYINELLIDNLIEYSDLQSIPIEFINGNILSEPQNIKLSVISMDTNGVIWNIGGKSSIYAINRYKGPYFPYLRKVNTEFDFQISDFKKYNTIFNIYDNNFGGPGITATGFWNELPGNIISSLFCKYLPIKINNVFTEELNYFELLKANISYTDIIINDISTRTIEKIDASVREYIIERYVYWLLDNFYYLSYVENELGQRLKYTKSSNNPYILNFESKDSYITNFDNLILVFVRK